MSEVLSDKIMEIEKEAMVSMPLNKYREISVLAVQGERIKEEVQAGVTGEICKDYNGAPDVRITNDFAKIFKDSIIKAIIQYALDVPEAMAILVDRGKHYYYNGDLVSYAFYGSDVVDLWQDPKFKEAWDAMEADVEAIKEEERLRQDEEVAKADAEEVEE
jgi:hypothetical protein